MKKICSSKKCTGCGLCIANCPKKCISFEKGFLGHVYPVINQKLCIDCGICKSHCPMNSELSLSHATKCFATWAKDDKEYETSTSGGVASVLSRHILNRGGVVYGCAMMNGVNVKHIRIDKTEDLHILKGSKYVQSQIVDIIQLLRKDIIDGKDVVFIGTPCQVAAVKSLFKKPMPNLYLVDLICHGVPSLDFLKKHVVHVAGSTENATVTFRDKNGMYVVVVVDGKIVYKKSLWRERYHDLYYNTFIDGFTYRDSCNQCIFAQPNRVSDITIGDFWGLGKYIPDNEIPPHPKGISVVLPNTDKGFQLFHNIKAEMNVYERTVEEAVLGNDQLRNPKTLDWRIRGFRFLMKYFNFPQMYYLFMADKILKLKIRK